ncbi:FHA domain-containing serine/threonine-protein kinase [Deinococcus maricopensis]|uniref:Serine/threonine protein kinase with FHA domain protein n=1 Tax=Deinococcus maricopensis (strain DSM 21211 / LMG 22137 / NRRL B-23946 / LB-34) TaxID=709986 RepID=E8U3P3_DEIML|nr:FHA domain-containing serine/threonine-protein kinase [Deinococcus maricopensis]ADV68667.1 serine/threonine protein kinase with FHA domain protein [Deinococcus maricopensis DSM 21211]
MKEGKLFHQFQLHRLLGEGWLGEVYAATDLDENREVAVRILADANAAQSHLVLHLERLLRKVADLRHRHILPVQPLEEREHRVFHAMTLAERGSVRQILQFQARSGQPLDLLVTLDIARQAAEALAFAHTADLMHGNLKPENLLLQPGRALLGREGYTVQVADFGLAELRAASYGTHDRVIVNALTYMSPEQCRGERHDTRTDLYALGVILYELVTGMVPFETRDAADALEKHQHVAPTQPSKLRRDLPGDVEEIILTCLAKRPEDRYADARELHDALQHAMNRMMPSGPEPTVRLPTLPALPAAPRVNAPLEPLRAPRLLVFDERHELLLEQPFTDASSNFTIGRAPGNTVVLDHAGVSRHHLSVEFDHGKPYITELNATNGTMMDGLPLSPMTRAAWPYGTMLYLRPYWLVMQAPQHTGTPPRIVVQPEVSELTLVPGQAHTLNVTLANTGPTVDHFRLSLDGVPEHWVTNAHHEVQLNPGMRTQAQLHLLVPRKSDSTAKTYDTTVLARSRENTSQFGRAPLRVTVTPFFDTRLTMTPRVRRAWRRTHYTLRVENHGNTPVRYTPNINDNEEAVRLLPQAGEVLRIPTSGRLQDAVNIQAASAGMLSRLRSGLGKITIDQPRADQLVNPGSNYEERLNVRLPLKWVGVTSHRTLHVDVDADLHEPGHVDADLHHNPFIPLWLLPILLALLALLAWWLSRPPTITRFDLATTGTLPAGQPFKLAWETSGARSVEIRELPGQKLARDGTVTVPGLQEPRTYTIVARGWFTQTQKERTVTPKLPAPIIQQFEATPPTAPSGSTVSVRWNVLNAKTVNIEPFGTVPAKGKQPFKVTQDTVFRLVAQNGDESVTKSRTVRVLGPQIRTFKPSIEAVKKGESITLTWDVANATTVTIDPLGTVPARGSRVLQPQQNTTYTIEASNGSGAPARAVTAVTVTARPPKITVFNVSPTRVEAGGTVRVRWKTEDAQTVELLTGTGSQTIGPEGELIAPAPVQSTDFTLTATNAEAIAVTRSQPLTVVPKPVVTPPPPPAGGGTTGATNGGSAGTGTGSVTPPPAKPLKVVYFKATPNTLVGGGNTTLSWQVENAGKIRIQGLRGPNLDGTFPAQGTYPTTVSKTTTFVLLAGDPKKPVKASAKVIVTPRPINVVRFETTTPTLTGKGTANLRWEVTGVNSIRIQGVRGPNVDGSFPNKSATTVPVSKTTTFVLLAGDPKQPKKATTVVTVKARPVVINSFRASPTSIVGQGTATLSWSVSGVNSVRIQGVRGTNNDGSFPAAGSFAVPVSKTTTFILLAGDPKQPARSTATVLVTRPASTPNTGTVTPPANPPANTIRIVDFSANPPSVRAGETTTLTWNVQGVARIRISGATSPTGGNDFPAQGSTTVTVDRTKSFTLSAGTGTNTQRRSQQVRATGSVSSAGSATVTDPGISGVWKHSFGELRLTTSGKRVTGTFISERTDVPGGPVTGTFSNSGTTVTLNATTSTGDPQTAFSFIVQFDENRRTFVGPYTFRGESERWCGWRPGTTPPTACQ